MQFLANHGKQHRSSVGTVPLEYLCNVTNIRLCIELDSAAPFLDAPTFREIHIDCRGKFVSPKVIHSNINIKAATKVVEHHLLFPVVCEDGVIIRHGGSPSPSWDTCACANIRAS